MSADEETVAELKARIEQLEERVGPSGISRRQLLAGLGAGGVAGLLGRAGTAAGSNQVGSIGEAANPIDVYGEDIFLQDAGASPSQNGQIAMNGSTIEFYSDGSVKSASDIGSGGGSTSTFDHLAIPGYGETPFISTSSSGWDSKSVFAGCIYEDIYFYGGNDSSTADGSKQEYDVGAFELTGPMEGSKNANNPIIDRSTVGLGNADEGLAPMDIKEINGTLYMFLSTWNADGTQDIAMMEASPSDPYSWSNFTVVLSSDYRMHAPCVITARTGDDSLLMYFATIPNSGDNFQIALADADKATPYSWTIDTNPVFSISNEATVYPWVWYNEGVYNMLYATTDVSQGSWGITYTASTDGTNFTANGYEVLTTENVTGRFDEDYVAVPRRYEDTVYYSGRSASSDSYIGIGAKSTAELARTIRQDVPRVQTGTATMSCPASQPADDGWDTVQSTSTTVDFGVEFAETPDIVATFNRNQSTGPEAVQGNIRLNDHATDGFAIIVDYFHTVDISTDTVAVDWVAVSNR